MTDDHADIRTLFATASEDLPPTRLTADDLIAAGERGRFGRRSRLGSAPRPRLAVAAAAVAVVATSGLVVLNRQLTAPGPGPTGGTSQPASTTPLATTGPPSAGPVLTGPVRLQSDGRTIYTRVVVSCPAPGYNVRAVENSTTVRLVVQIDRIGPPRCGGSRPTESQYQSVGLAAPLAGRSVVDSTGAALAVLTTHLATIGYLPPGYAKGGIDDCARGTSAGGPGPLDGPPPGSCVTPFLHGDAVLTVGQYFGATPAEVMAWGAGDNTHWQPPVRTTVRGHPAQLRAGYFTLPNKPGRSYLLQLAWSEHDETLLITSSVTTQPAQLSQAELTKAALGLHWTS